MYLSMARFWTVAPWHFTAMRLTRPSHFSSPHTWKILGLSWLVETSFATCHKQWCFGLSLKHMIHRRQQYAARICVDFRWRCSIFEKSLGQTHTASRRNQMEHCHRPNKFAVAVQFVDLCPIWGINIFGTLDQGNLSTINPPCFCSFICSHHQPAAIHDLYGSCQGPTA